jgi:peptide-methionine (S)-S-oxide reductase
MIETATFGAGCFWGIEQAFRQIEGVVEAACGYMGGHTQHPTYEEVCGKGTGHAEVVQVRYDPHLVSYDQLLDAFWDMHDPTTPDRQGPDVGDQYRSAIFTHTSEQQEQAERSRHAADESGRFADPIVTQIVPASAFWRAEEYHQQYFARRGGGSCHL